MVINSVSNFEKAMIVLGLYRKKLSKREDNEPYCRSVFYICKYKMERLSSYMWSLVVICLYLVNLFMSAAWSHSKYQNDEFNHIGNVMWNILWLVFYPFLVVSFLYNNRDIKLVMKKAETLLRNIGCKEMRIGRRCYILAIGAAFNTILSIVDLITDIHKSIASSWISTATFSVSWAHSHMLDIMMTAEMCIFTNVAIHAQKQSIACAKKTMKNLCNRDTQNDFKQDLRKNTKPKPSWTSDTYENSRKMSSNFCEKPIPRLITSSRPPCNLSGELFEEVAAKLGADDVLINEYVETMMTAFSLPCLVWMLYSAVALSFTMYYAVDSAIAGRSDCPLIIASLLGRLFVMFIHATPIDDLNNLVSLQYSRSKFSSTHLVTEF